jgi:hypothetical protein
VFTARYALSPYIKHIRFVFKGLNKQLNPGLHTLNPIYTHTHTHTHTHTQSVQSVLVPSLHVRQGVHWWLYPTDFPTKVVHVAFSTHAAFCFKTACSRMYHVHTRGLNASTAVTRSQTHLQKCCNTVGSTAAFQRLYTYGVMPWNLIKVNISKDTEL